MPIIQSAPQERTVMGSPPPGLRGAEQSMPLVSDASSEEDAGYLHHASGKGLGVRRLSGLCAVAALVGVVILFVTGSSSSKQPAASRFSMSEAAVELASVVRSSSDEKYGGKGLWNALEKVRYGPPPSQASEPDSEASDDIEPELPQGPQGFVQMAGSSPSRRSSQWELPEEIRQF